MKDYLPTYVRKSIYDIDYVYLKNQGITNLIFDLDNTLLPYGVSFADNLLINFNIYLHKLGFRIFIISNNSKSRIELLGTTFILDGFEYRAGKPFVNKINKYMELHNLRKEASIFIGDQVLTDIIAANRAGVASVLVASLDRSTEKWYTRLNRLREENAVKRCKKIDPVKTEEVLKLIREE